MEGQRKIGRKHSAPPKPACLCSHRSRKRVNIRLPGPGCTSELSLGMREDCASVLPNGAVRLWGGTLFPQLSFNPQEKEGNVSLDTILFR